MRYREAYFRQELQDFSDYLEGQVEVKIQKAKSELPKGKVLNERAMRRKLEKYHTELYINVRNEKERFNNLCYKEIEKVIGEMPTDFKYKFDNYATGFGLIIEELLKAKNTTELLTVCKLYNQGLMDNTFAEIKKQREDAGQDNKDKKQP